MGDTEMPTYHGQTKVDPGHLIRVVLPKQYDFDLRIASVMELVANSLDAKPSVIAINLDQEKGILEVSDNGNGMSKQLFEGYHDITSPKITGSGIGFAGQGAKLALNFCSKILTETFSPSYRGYSEWHLEAQKAPWQIYENQTLSLDHFGTKVTLHLDDESKTFYTPDLIKQILIEHYFPLLDEELLKVYMGKSPILVDKKRSLRTYRPIYEKGLKVSVNGKQITVQPLQSMLEAQKEVTITVYTRAKARGFFGLARYGIEESLQGIAICSFGKVIERTWFKKEPREKQKIGGWIEAPYLIQAVTTDKCGFQRGNRLWEGFFRKAQAEFTKWLEETGLSEKPVEREADFSNLEREINSILKNLPELTVFGIRSQRDVAIPDEKGEQRELGDGTQKVGGTTGGETEGEGVLVYPGDEPSQALTQKPGAGPPATNHQRTIRGGIRISLVERPDLEEEARLEGETVLINKSHPAYSKAERKGFLDYHFVKSIALSLIKFKLERDPEPTYQEAFELSQKFFRLWGQQ